MNKIKLLYDVFQTFKSKEAVTGVLRAEIEKDQVKVFTIQKDFAKNLSTGQTRVKMNAEANYEARTEGHEYYDRFPHCPPDRGHHEFLPPHHSHCHGREGLKRKFAKWALALSILNALQMEEKDNQTIELSLKATDLPADAKQLVREKVAHVALRHPLGCSLLQDFQSGDPLDFGLIALVNKNSEVEKIVITAAGNRSDSQTQQAALTASAELSLVW
ncbi:Hypothetical protein LUCI_3453 [Lucifera butyrica]|uniref:Uncharacterized protein n=1 Tax=Lucifera butyrica TaxID=1351585 RepID=A0A498RB10_9FIRM|nr:hypothetical protein [Lucifera butyrica]VBB08185.1 Hypothetical protein LUCI_3453 [Lucifera butyrica]